MKAPDASVFAWTALVLAITLNAGAAPPPPGTGLPIVVTEVPAKALAAEPLAGGTLRISPGEGGRLVLVDASGRRQLPVVRGADAHF